MRALRQQVTVAPTSHAARDRARQLVTVVPLSVARLRPGVAQQTRRFLLLQVGDPDFAIVDEAYPYIAKRLLTDGNPRLQEALRWVKRCVVNHNTLMRCLLTGAVASLLDILPCYHSSDRYMVYGKEKVFDADRLIDLLNAFETFTVAASSARGDMDNVPQPVVSSSGGGWQQGSGSWPGGSSGSNTPGVWPTPLGGLLAAPFALLAPNTGGAAAGWPFAGAEATASGQPGSTQQNGAGAGGIGLFGLPPNRFDLRQGSGTLDSQGRLREALRFVFSQVRLDLRLASVGMLRWRWVAAPVALPASYSVAAMRVDHGYQPVLACTPGRRAPCSAHSSWTSWSSPSTHSQGSSLRCSWYASALAALASQCCCQAPQ